MKIYDRSDRTCRFRLHVTLGIGLFDPANCHQSSIPFIISISPSLDLVLNPLTLDQMSDSSQKIEPSSSDSVKSEPIPPLSIHATLAKHDSTLKAANQSINRMAGLMESLVLDRENYKSRSEKSNSAQLMSMMGKPPVFDCEIKNQSLSDKRLEFALFVDKLKVYIDFMEAVDGKPLSSAMKTVIVLSSLSNEAWSIVNNTRLRLLSSAVKDVAGAEFSIDDLLGELSLLYGADPAENVVDSITKVKQKGSSIEVYYIKFTAAFKKLVNQGVSSRDVAVSMFLAGLDIKLQEQVRKELAIRASMSTIGVNDFGSALSTCLTIGKALESANSSSVSADAAAAPAISSSNLNWRPPNRDAYRAGRNSNNRSFNNSSARSHPQSQPSSKPLSPEEILKFFANKYSLSTSQVKRLMDNNQCLKCREIGHSAKICRGRAPAVGLNMAAFETGNDDEEDHDDDTAGAPKK